MTGLFDDDDAYKQAVVKRKRRLVRNRSGQFCTEEERRIEGIERENAILKRNCEVYFRNWMAVGDRAIQLDRENHELKEKIREYEKRTERKDDKSRILPL